MLARNKGKTGSEPSGQASKTHDSLAVMKSSIKNVVLVGLGLAVGCAAAAVKPTSVGVATAQATAGKWQCYRVHDFPDVQEAAKEGKDYTASMNKIAPGAAQDQLIQIGASGGGNPNYLCVKN